MSSNKIQRQKTQPQKRDSIDRSTEKTVKVSSLVQEQYSGPIPHPEIIEKDTQKSTQAFLIEF